MASISHRARTLGVAVLILAVALALLAGAPLVEPATAQEGPRIERVSGADRFATAAEASADAFTSPGDVDVAYLATGLDFADALAAGAVAAAEGGPVLLTLPNLLPDPTREELERLSPSEVVIVGGLNAVQDAVVSQVGAALPDAEVTRIDGANRFETAANLARRGFPDGATTVYVATGLDFPDALGAVPAAYSEDAPLVLVARDAATLEAREVLEELGPTDIIVVGGPNAVAFDALDELREFGDVTRVEGRPPLPTDRFGTAAAVAQRAFVESSTLYIATGGAFPDALAGGPVAAANRGALMLVANTLVIPDTVDEIVRLNPRTIKVLGGSNAVSDAVIAELNTILDRTVALEPGTRPEFTYTNVREIGRSFTGVQGVGIATTAGASQFMSAPPTGSVDLAPEILGDGQTVAFIRQPSSSAPEDRRRDELWIFDAIEGPRSLRQVAGGAGELSDCEFGRLRSRPGDVSEVLVVCNRPEVATGSGDDREVVHERGATEAYRVDVATDAVTAIPVEGDPEESEYIAGSWSPDGATLALTRIDYDIEDGDRFFGSSRIVALDIEADTTANISGAFDEDLISDLVWSADGQEVVGLVRRIGFLGASSDGRITVFDADGSTPNGRTLFSDPDAWFIDDVLPDGRILTRLSQGESSDRFVTLQIVDTAGSGSVETTLIGEGDLEGDNDTIARARVDVGNNLVIYDQGERAGFGLGDRQLTVRNGTLWTITVEGEGNQQLEFIPGNQLEPTFSPRSDLRRAR